MGLIIEAFRATYSLVSSVKNDLEETAVQHMDPRHKVMLMIGHFQKLGVDVSSEPDQIRGSFHKIVETIAAEVEKDEKKRQQAAKLISSVVQFRDCFWTDAKGEAEDVEINQVKESLRKRVEVRLATLPESSEE